MSEMSSHRTDMEDRAWLHACLCINRRQKDRKPGETEAHISCLTLKHRYHALAALTQLISHILMLEEEGEQIHLSRIQSMSVI